MISFGTGSSHMDTQEMLLTEEGKQLIHDEKQLTQLGLFA